MFGITALERHVTVTSLPAACAGLTYAQVNDAVDGALATVAGWIIHGGLRREQAGRVPSSAIFAHAGLAVAGLLVWAVYLATGLTGVGWADCVFVVAVTSLGVALISLWLPEHPAATRPARHPPASTVAAHGVFAVTTILLVLAAIGLG
jgi:hypothetical protein